MRTIEKRSIVSTKILHQKKFKQLAIFSHFDQECILGEYVIYALKELYKLNFDIVFVTTSEKIHSSQLAKIEKYLFMHVVKKNCGYDFMSWKTGLNLVENYKEYETILLLNDSIFFPLIDPREMFEIMQEKKLDFWGIYDANVPKYYIQSFFWVFNKEIIKSKMFSDFWNNCEILNDKSEIIRKYEFGFTSLALAQGFKVGSYIKTSDVVKKLCETNPKINNDFFINKSSFYFFWDTLIKHFNAPYLKKNILSPMSSSYNPTTLFWKELVSTYTNYDVLLIEKAISLPTDISESLEKEKVFYKNINTFYYFLNLSKEKKIIALYGIGEIGLVIAAFLGDKVKFLIDRSKKSNISRYIHSPEEIGTLGFDVLLIGAIGREKEILKNLGDIKKIALDLGSHMTGNPLHFSNTITKLLRNLEALFATYGLAYKLTFYTKSKFLILLLKPYTNAMQLNWRFRINKDDNQLDYFQLKNKEVDMPPIQIPFHS